MEESQEDSIIQPTNLEERATLGSVWQKSRKGVALNSPVSPSLP